MAEDDIEQDVDTELDDTDELSPTKGKKKLIIIAAVILLVLIGGGGAFFLMGSDEHGEDVAVEEIGEDGEPISAVANVPVFYDVPEFLVDLNSSDRTKSSFLKMKVAIELSKQEDVATLEAYMPRVRDNFITYLRELRASDLSGSAGLYRLREELMLRINQAIAPAKVNNILFKEIIVQ